MPSLYITEIGVSSPLNAPSTVEKVKRWGTTLYLNMSVVETFNKDNSITVSPLFDKFVK